MLTKSDERAAVEAQKGFDRLVPDTKPVVKVDSKKENPPKRNKVNK